MCPGEARSRPSGKIDFGEFAGKPGMDPEKFRAYLAAELGKRGADVATVSPSQQGEKTDLGSETSPHHEGKSNGHAKPERLRTILRAPIWCRTLQVRPAVTDDGSEARAEEADGGPGGTRRRCGAGTTFILTLATGSRHLASNGRLVCGAGCSL
jgi:hypothetical protein